MSLVTASWDLLDRRGAAVRTRAARDLLIPIALYRESTYRRIEIVCIKSHKGKAEVAAVSLRRVLHAGFDPRFTQHMSYWDNCQSAPEILRRLGHHETDWRGREQSFEVAFAVTEESAGHIDALVGKARRRKVGRNRKGTPK